MNARPVFRLLLSLPLLTGFLSNSTLNFRLFAEENLQVKVTLNLKGPKQKIYPGIVGGNVLYNYSSVLFRDAEAFKKFGGGSVRFHMFDDTRWGQRWDTHTIEPTGVTKGYQLENLEEDSGSWIKELQGAGKIDVDCWENAGPQWNRHSVKMAVSNAADHAALLMPKLDQTGDKISYQFALKLDEFVTSLKWLLLKMDDNRANLFIDSKGYLGIESKADSNLSWINNQPLNLGKWYLITVLVTTQDISLWVDDNLLFQQSTSVGVQNWPNWHLGYNKGNTAVPLSIKFHIDEVRVHSNVMGPQIIPPWDNETNQGRFDKYFTFDGNWATIDDFLVFAEEASLEPILQIPLSAESTYGTDPDPGTIFSWDTLTYWADLVEYVNGEADQAYQTKTFDFTHLTPTDNWANLRAQRGRAAPYKVKYIEIGNEPYYQGWSKNKNWTGYANKWIAQALLIKSADPNVILGLPGRKAYSNSDDIWAAAIPLILSEGGEGLIGFLAVHHYSKIKNCGGHPCTYQDQSHWYLGASSSWRTYLRPDAEAGRAWYRESPLALDAIDQYFSNLPEAEKPFLALTEFNFEWEKYKFDNVYVGNYLSDAFQRISALGEMSKMGIAFGNTFSLDTDQKYVYGIIGDDDQKVVGRVVTPSYWVYLLWSRITGTGNSYYVPSQVNTPLITWDQINDVKVTHDDPYEPLAQVNKWGETYTTPLVSVWPIEKGKFLYLVIVNRSLAQSANIYLDIRALKVRKVSGQQLLGKNGDPFDTEVIVTASSDLPGIKDKNRVKKGWQNKVTVSPLSMNFIKIKKIESLKLAKKKLKPKN